MTRKHSIDPEEHDAVRPLSARLSAPGVLWRIATLVGLWFIIFGSITALTPLHMEGGFNIPLEKLNATLLAPVLGWIGMAYFLGGDRPSAPVLMVSLLVLLSSTLWMLFFCRTRRSYFVLIAIQTIIITLSSIGYSLMIRYGSDLP